MADSAFESRSGHIIIAQRLDLSGSRVRECRLRAQDIQLRSTFGSGFVEFSNLPQSFLGLLDDLPL